MVQAEPKHLNEVRKIVSELAPGIPVWVFGSRLDPSPKRHADLDLALLDDPPMPFASFSRLMDALEESDVPFRVDVCRWSLLTEEFRRILEKKHELFVDSASA